MPTFTHVRSISSALGSRRARPVALGLGGNVGNRARILRQAVALLTTEATPMLTAPRLSSVYESAAMLDAGAPPEWNHPFLNMVLVGETLLSPPALLSEIKRIEHKLGRQPRGHWAPREIDIDILAYGEEVLHTPAMTVPHVGLLERSFTLLPLAELWPDWRYPVPGPLQGSPLFALLERYYPGGQAADLQHMGDLERLP